MKFEPRRIMDFIMGICSGFCFFYGQFIGYALGTLMLVSFIINVYRQTMLDKIDEAVKEDKE